MPGTTLHTAAFRSLLWQSSVRRGQHTEQERCAQVQVPSLVTAEVTKQARSVSCHPQLQCWVSQAPQAPPVLRSHLWHRLLLLLVVAVGVVVVLEQVESTVVWPQPKNRAQHSPAPGLVHNGVHELVKTGVCSR